MSSYLNNLLTNTTSRYKTFGDRSSPTRQTATQRTTLIFQEYSVHTIQKKAGHSLNGFHPTQKLPRLRRPHSSPLRRSDNKDRHRKWVAEEGDSAISGIIRRNNKHRNRYHYAGQRQEVVELVHARPTHGQLSDARASKSRQTIAESTSWKLPELFGGAPASRSFTTPERRNRIRHFSTGKAQSQIMGKITESSTARQRTIRPTGWSSTLSRRTEQQLWQR
ncbi:Mso1 Sec1 bdg domain containing protein [Pyrenophora tritici-repentis]|nr:Mso1 Sec1 bdg domain containing protein [Pyrenophora tritici-repentis]